MSSLSTLQRKLSRTGKSGRRSDEHATCDSDRTGHLETYLEMMRKYPFLCMREVVNSSTYQSF